MLHLEGIPISPGYASGIAVVYDYEIQRKLELPHRAISHAEVETECKRLDDALETSSQDLKLVEQTALSDPRLVETAALLSVHSAMANEIAALVKQYIGREFVNVEQALDAVIRDFVECLQELDNAYFRQREQDVRDVGRRMMRDLTCSPPWTSEPLPPRSVIVARELLPSEAAELAKSGMVAIVSEHGGKFSHTAIVARSLGTPAVSGIYNVTSRILPGMPLLVDGSGSVVIDPTQADEESFVKRKREFERLATSIAVKEKLPCVTQDGIEISLLANVGLPEEIGGVAEHNLAGAGLFRTEFLFLRPHQGPSFEMQCEMYDRMAKGLDGLPLVIRTFDLGGHKLPPFLLSEGSERHASLHLRGLRFSLAERELLDIQLRAILHVAQASDIRILFPMVIGSDDFAQAIAAVDRVADQLSALRSRPPIGAMIETPAALYALHEILELADFVALGTNDLTQYMLATDRDLAEGIDDCTAMHPAVLRAIRQVVKAAEKRACPVCVCGEEAGDADFARLLVGLGVRELSLTPARAALVRHALRHVRYDDAREVAHVALQCRSPQQVRQLLQHLPSTEASIRPWQNDEPCDPELLESGHRNK